MVGLVYTTRFMSSMELMFTFVHKCVCYAVEHHLYGFPLNFSIYTAILHLFLVNAPIHHNVIAESSFGPMTSHVPVIGFIAEAERLHPP